MPASIQSLSVWPYLVCCVVVLPIYWNIERHAPDPIVQPAFFHSKQIRLSATIGMGVGTMSSATAFYPLLAVAALGVTESSAAFLLVPGVLVTTLASPITGALVDRVGSRLVLVTGLTCVFIGFLLFGLLPMSTFNFIAASIIAGLGFAASLGAPLRMVVLNEAPPEHRTSAQGLLNVFLSIGHLLGAAIVGGVAASLGGGTVGYQTAYLALACITVLLVLMGLALKSRAAEKLPATPAPAEAQ
jgi:MFS family permease